MKVLGSAVAGEATKKVATDVTRQAKKALRQPETKAALKAVAKKVGIPLAKAAGVATGIGVTLAVGGAALTANRQREAKRWADQQLAITKKKLGAALTPEHARTLWNQYYNHALKQPVTNSFVGK